ncbi:MAG: flagellar export chaperone FliS [Magnetococcales bacterium]|nr:flagellar export chaperone FliS [Magnetococcales bacterium]
MDMEVTGRKVETSEVDDLSPLEILIQLYEGAIRFLEQAATACEGGMVDEFKEALGRGRRIIEEFQRTLDFSQGSAVSNQLNELYNFMLENLAQADLTHDVQYVQQVITNLRILLDGWRGAESSQAEG